MMMMSRTMKLWIGIIAALVAAGTMAALVVPAPGFYGQCRYPIAGSSTQAAFAMTAGRLASIAAVPSGSAGDSVSLRNVRGVGLEFGGAGADNTTFDYRIYLVYYGRSGTSISDADIVYFGGGTCTLSASVGASATTLVTSSERLADTVTWTLATTATTPKGIGAIAETAAPLGGGTSAVYSPANDTPAKLLIPWMGNADAMIVEFDMTGATSGFCLWEQWN